MVDALSGGISCLDEATVVAFLEGSLSAKARARVDAHVDGCATCLALLAALARTEPEETWAAPERYELGEEIGVGGMGQVFEAFDTVLGRQVALKCVRAGPEDEAAARRFEREMALTARLQHPSIIPIYDAGFFPDGSHYFAMRLVEGQTLDAALDETSTFEERMALVPSVRRACEAVAFAHEQSVIHRDLKPANVLVGPFGETVVLDWGLAKRLEEEEVEGESMSDGRDIDQGMTRPGAVMGTPGYIAPEVRRGEPADARADVYSLGKILERLVADAGEHDGREMLSDLRAVILRATAEDRETRYLDAAQLCEDLLRFEAGQRVGARDYSVRSRVRRFARRHRSAIALSAGFVIVGVAAGIGVTAWMRAEPLAPCTGAQEALAGVWDDVRRAQVDQAFQGVPNPFAQNAWTRAERALDDYAQAWVAMHTAACEATASGAQSSAMLDRRMACLDGAATQLRATVDVLADADAKVVERADAIVEALQPISRCSDMIALQAEVPLPEPDDADEVDRAMTLLAKAGVLRQAARTEEAEQVLQEAAALLEGTGYPPVLTKLELSRAKLAFAQGDNEAADALLAEVMRRGTSMSQWDEVREALIWGMLVVGNRLMKPEQALRYRPMAQGLATGEPAAEASFYYHLATVLRTAGQDAQAEDAAREALELRMRRGDVLGESSVRRLLAAILMARGDPEAAERELRAALDVRIKRLGSDHPIVANTRSSLANALQGQGKLAEAEIEARAALEATRAALAPGHELIAAAHVALGNILADQGKDGEAEAQYRAALEAIEAKLGPNHPRAALIQNNLGNLLWSRGSGPEAEAAFRAAFEVFEKALGPDHPSTVTVRVGIGNALHLQGKLTQAEEQMRAVLKARSAILAPDDPKLGLAHTNLGGVLLSAERMAEAESEYRAGLTIIEAGMDSGHPQLARVRTELAELLLRQGQLREGLELAERAWSASQGQDFPIEDRARAAFVLGQIVWEHDVEQRGRAVKLVQDALESCKACLELPEQIAAWQASRR